MYFFLSLKKWVSPYINRFLQPDTIIPNQTNPQSWNRFSYVENRPINFNDPTGHISEWCETDPNSDRCKGYVKDQKNQMNAQWGKIQNKKLQEEFDEFPGIPTYSEEQMEIIPWGDYNTTLTPDELALLGMEDVNKKTLLYYRMAAISNSARQTAQRLFPGQLGNNSPLNAFQHAFWSALMVQEFGLEYSITFAYAHEKSFDEVNGSQFMDQYNNEIGRQIAQNNPNVPTHILAAQVLQSLSNGDLVVWDEQNIYFSNECPICSKP